MMKGIFSFSRGQVLLGPDTSVVESGGGAAGPVADDFARFLQSILGGGEGPVSGPPGGTSLISRAQGIIGGGPTPGSDPVGQTSEIAKALNELIAGPDVTGQQAAIQQTIQQDTERQVANLRERFTAGGGSQGTPSAVAEGLFRSNVTPRIATAVGDLELRANRQRLEALLPFLQILSQFAGRGVSQARTDTIVNPGPFATIASLGGSAAGIAGAASG